MTIFNERLETVYDLKNVNTNIRTWLPPARSLPLAKSNVKSKLILPVHHGDFQVRVGGGEADGEIHIVRSMPVRVVVALQNVSSQYVIPDVHWYSQVKIEKVGRFEDDGLIPFNEEKLVNQFVDWAALKYRKDKTKSEPDLAPRTQQMRPLATANLTKDEEKGYAFNTHRIYVLVWAFHKNAEREFVSCLFLDHATIPANPYDPEGGPMSIVDGPGMSKRYGWKSCNH